jgi:endogenous inhibitor of DNA gyrase (YacG/DUF329 family)
MTDKQKNEIKTFRDEGLSYAQIAALVGLSPNTVKSFCRRLGEKNPLCRNCGKPLNRREGRKPRIFCSDRCRCAWWNAHRELVKQKSACHLRCIHCGKEFSDYNSHRKYCCRNCYIQGRFHNGGVP